MGQVDLFANHKNPIYLYIDFGICFWENIIVS